MNTLEQLSIKARLLTAKANVAKMNSCHNDSDGKFCSSGKSKGTKELPLKVGDRAQRNPKIWKDTAEQKQHNFGTIISIEEGKDNKGRKVQGYRFKSDSDAAILKDPTADKWDKKYAEKGTWFTKDELVAIKQ